MEMRETDFSDRFWLDCFNELSTCRQVGMGSGAIPWTAINEYALSIGYPFPKDFSFLIRAMDTAWLKWHNDQRKAES